MARLTPYLVLGHSTYSPEGTLGGWSWVSRQSCEGLICEASVPPETEVHGQAETRAFDP